MQILFAAKTLYQLSCHDECAAAVFQYPRFKDVWLLFSRHAAGDVRQRAAGVFNKVIDLNIGYVQAGWGTHAIPKNCALQGGLTQPLRQGSEGASSVVQVHGGGGVVWPYGE